MSKAGEAFVRAGGGKINPKTRKMFKATQDRLYGVAAQMMDQRLMRLSPQVIEAIGQLRRDEAEAVDTSGWWTVTKAAEQTGEEAAVISRACDAKRISSVGKRRKRRINPISAMDWAKSRLEKDARKHQFKLRN